MAKSPQPLFLARASYRKRRLRDGSRILPIFGFVLLCLPLLGPQGTQGIMGHWGYLFALWLGLIALAAALARGLADSDSATDLDTGPQEDSEPQPEEQSPAQSQGVS
jgi:hypothetical protein